jgi:transcriptional regulator with XRE-family HTH domain
MSQSVLGDQLRLTFQQVQKYEKGTNRISASRLLEMTRILQVGLGAVLLRRRSTGGGPRRKRRSGSVARLRIRPFCQFRLARSVPF